MDIDDFGFEDEFAKEPPRFEKLEPKSVNRDLATYPKEVQLIALARLKYIMWVKQRLKGGWTERNLSPLLKSVPQFEGENLPSWRTLARWYKSYQSAEGNILSLIPKHHRKGNRNTYSDTDKFYEMALNRYLTKERLSVAAVYRYY